MPIIRRLRGEREYFRVVTTLKLQYDPQQAQQQHRQEGQQTRDSTRDSILLVFLPVLFISMSDLGAVLARFCYNPVE